MATGLKQEVIAAVDKQGYWLGEEQCLHKEGHLFPVRLMVSGVKDEEDEISHFVCSFHDITQERETARHIERLAYYDDLCDLYNRRSLNDIMQRTLANPERAVGGIAAAGSRQLQVDQRLPRPRLRRSAAPGGGGAAQVPCPRRT